MNPREAIDFAVNYIKKWHFHLADYRQRELYEAWDAYVLSKQVNKLEEEVSSPDEEYLSDWDSDTNDSSDDGSEETEANITPPDDDRNYGGFTTGY